MKLPASTENYRIIKSTAYDNISALCSSRRQLAEIMPVCIFNSVYTGLFISALLNEKEAYSQLSY
jgi:hypothetical protein